MAKTRSSPAGWAWRSSRDCRATIRTTSRRLPRRSTLPCTAAQNRERHRFDVHPSPHDLWDTYLPAFRAAIVEAKADSIMCAYNAIDGSPACANKELLGTVLRQDWNFQGFVTSDCGAVDDFFTPNGHHYSADRDAAAVAAIRTGTDTNCGNTYLALTDAVKRGLIKEAEIDISLKRLFTARFKLGLFDPDSMNPYASVPFSEVGSPAHHALALDAARESMVLLKNDSGALPLKAGVKTIAVIGPNAASLAALEGNYNAVPRRPGASRRWNRSRVQRREGPLRAGVGLCGRRGSAGSAQLAAHGCGVSGRRIAGRVFRR